MDIYFSRIKNLFLCLVLILIIPIVIGPPKDDPPKVNPPPFDPNNEAIRTERKRIQLQCFEDIQHIFRNNIKKRNNKKEYFQYALLHLRYPTDEETNAHFNVPGPGEKLSPYLLYETHFGTCYHNEYAYKYFKKISDKYIDIDDIPSPDEYCDLYKAIEHWKKDYCLISLQCFGFLSNDKKETIDFAFQHIVLRDIELRTDFDPNLKVPDSIDPELPIPDRSFAESYLKLIHGRIKTHPGDLPWPDHFCDEEYRLYVPPEYQEASTSSESKQELPTH